MAALQMDDIDLDSDAVYIAGAARAPRAVPFDRPAARALEGYLAGRASRDRAYLPGLWLGRRGRLASTAARPNQLYDAGTVGSCA